LIAARASAKGSAKPPAKQQEYLCQHGYLLIDREFELGRVLFEEMETYRPVDHFVDSDVPSLVVHGDRDSYVSYEVAKQAAARQGGAEFHTVEGSDHGFDTREHEDEAIMVTVDWLTARRAEQS
jgi:pimeloyl-ACP methyl ester carboxylesterase